MLTVNQEFYSSPYYFFLKEGKDSYSLYLSAEETITEARDKDIIIKVPKSKLEAVKKYLEKVLKSKKKKSTLLIEQTTWMTNTAKWKQAIKFCKDKNMDFLLLAHSKKDGFYPVNLDFLI